MTRLRRFLLSSRSSKGAVAVEFALIFPVFIFMIFAMFDMGRFLIVQMSMNSAAHAGARAASMSAGTSAISSRTRASVTEQVVRLSTLDSNLDATTAITPAAYVCPLVHDGFTYCFDQSVTLSKTCSQSAANTSAVATASVSFKWLTPIQWILTFSSPDSPVTNPWNRDLGDVTTIQGTATVLCQN